MKKKSKKSIHAGLRKERRCHYPERAGTLYLWDCHVGAPMKPGPEGQRWAVEWRPGGRGKPLYVHLPNQRTAMTCFRTLAKADGVDRWGLFVLQEPEQAKQNGSQTESPPQGGGGGLVIARDTPLTRALVASFDTLEVIALLREQLAATRPIYASSDGNQEVVGYEPDWPTRREALKTMLNYREGLPVKRVEETTVHKTSAEDFVSMMDRPAFRAAAKALIADAENRQKKRLENIIRSVPAEFVKEGE